MAPIIGTGTIILRKRLKTKTGCATCRARRKKCDDQHPRCSACTRLGLQCRWTQQASVEEIHDRSALLPDVQDLVIRGQGTSRNDHYSPASHDALGITPPDTTHAGATAMLEAKTEPSPPEHENDIDSEQQHPTSIVLHDRGRSGHDQAPFVLDHPSWLRASPTSILTEAFDKQVYQYIRDRGAHILVLAKHIQTQPMNVFKLHFSFAASNPSLMHTHLAIGASHLSRLTKNEPLAPTMYYQRAIKALRTELDRTDVVQPSEAACLTAGALRVFDMGQDVKPEERTTHFLGFSRLTQLRIQRTKPHDWRAGRLTLELFIYHYVVSATFYGNLILADKPLDYADTLIDILNAGPRPFGQDIIGVPPDLIGAVYRLSWLRANDSDSPQWRQDVTDVATTLEHCQQTHGPYYGPSEISRMISATLYRAACSVLAYKLLHRRVHVSHPSIARHVRTAVSTLALQMQDQVPQTNLGWPTFILGLAAADSVDLMVLQNPFREMIRVSGLVGFSSALDVLDTAWAAGPGSASYLGLDALFHQDMVEKVHL